MMKRFWVFILLFSAASLTLADDMPPLPSDAPASAVAKDMGMPALPDAAASAANVATNGMPALPDAGTVANSAASAASSAASNSMPALPDAGPVANAAASAVAKDSGMPALPDASPAAPAKAGANDMPALPDSSAPAKAAPAAAGSSDMPALPDSSAPVKSAAPKAAASPTDSDMNTVPMDDGSAAAAPAKTHESKPWLASKERPLTRFKGWIRSKGGNITSRLSWASQQVLNAMDAKRYKMDKEEGVYEGEKDKGPQFRKFTFIVPKTKDQVLVLLKEDKKKILFVVGPDEDPAPADHTYAQVAKMRAEDMRVWQIIKAKFGSRIGPYKFVPSWDAPYNRSKGTADE